MGNIAVDPNEFTDTPPSNAIAVDQNDFSAAPPKPPKDPLTTGKLHIPEEYAASHQAAVKAMLDTLPGVPRPPMPAGLPTNPPGVTGSMIGATEPGLLDRARAVIMGSGRTGDTAIGRAFGETHEGPAAPQTPTQNLPLIRPSEVTPEITAALPYVVPGAGLVTGTEAGKGAVAGLVKFAEGNTTAPNLLMLAGGEGLGLLGKVNSLIPKAVSAGFSVDMIHSLWQQAPELKKVWQRGDPREIAEQYTQAAATLGMAGMTAYHAAKGTGADLAETFGRTKPTVESATRSVDEGAAILDGGVKAVDPSEFTSEPPVPRGTAAEKPQVAAQPDVTQRNEVQPSPRVSVDKDSVTVHQEDGKPFMRIPVTDRHTLVTMADNLRAAGDEQSALKLEAAAPDRGQSIAHEIPRQDTLNPKIAETLAEGSTRINPLGGIETLESVPLAKIQPAAPTEGRPQGNVLDPQKVKDYTANPPAVAPELRTNPEGGWTTYDGHHRVQAAVERGDKYILAWTSTPGEDGLPVRPERRVAPPESVLNPGFIERLNAQSRQEAIDTPPIVGRGEVTPAKPPEIRAVDPAEFTSRPPVRPEPLSTSSMKPQADRLTGKGGPSTGAAAQDAREGTSAADGRAGVRDQEAGAGSIIRRVGEKLRNLGSDTSGSFGRQKPKSAVRPDTRKFIEDRLAEGQSAEEVAKRVWNRWGYLADAQGDAVRLRTNALNEGTAKYELIGAKKADAQTSLVDTAGEEGARADAERNKDKLLGDQLSAQFKAPVSKDEQVKKLKKGEQPAQTSMFEKTPENPQGSLFGPIRNLLGDESGAVNKNLASLGTKKFIEKDVIPAARRLSADLAEARDQALRFFAPAARDSSAEFTGLNLRQRMAQFARRYAQGEARLRDAETFFSKRTPEENYRFIDNVEKGLGRGDNPMNVANADLYQPGDKELEPIAKTLARMLDQRKQEVQALGEGALDKFYTNYFPHLFEKPTKAIEYVNQFFSKANLEGSANFLKRRDFPTFKEALAAGLKPVSDNPIQLVMLKAREMDRYLMAHHILRDLGDQGLAVRLPAPGEEVTDALKKYSVPSRNDIPAGMTEIANLFGGARWYAEDGAAQVMNNYLTPGLRTASGAYRIAAGINNTMNQANLGLSAFHLTGEIIRSGVSRAALGIEDLVNGKPIRGSIRIATLPAGPFVDYLQGSKLLKEYFKPGKEGAPIAGIADALMKGGGRAVEPEEFATQATKSFLKAIHEGNYPGAALRLPLAAMEKLAAPLMQHLIPRLKLGVFAGMAANDLEKLGPGASVTDVQRAMAKSWDATDDRMGQMVYDNLFMNKTFKDAMHLAVRSVGWNLGSLRGHVGGLLDMKHMGAEVWKAPWGGKMTAARAEMTHRIGWNLAMPLVSAIIGATYQYAHTGQGPQEAKDYFFPKREDGTRVAMPTDVKDVYHWATQPLRTAEDKTGPLINTILETLNNRDYYNRPIHDTQDPYYRQGLDYLEFLGRQMAPFTMQQFMGGAKKRIPESNPEHAVEGVLGITKASKDIQQEGPGPRRRVKR